jgi:hypothetical protein
MTTPQQPDEPQPPAVPGSDGPARHLSTMWALILRRFRDHLHTTHEEPDGRTK